MNRQDSAGKVINNSELCKNFKFDPTTKWYLNKSASSRKCEA